MEWHRGTLYCLLNFLENVKLLFKKTINKTPKISEGRDNIRRTVTLGHNKSLLHVIHRTESGQCVEYRGK